MPFDALDEEVGKVVGTLPDGTVYRQVLVNPRPGEKHVTPDGRTWVAVHEQIVDGAVSSSPFTLHWKGQAVPDEIKHEFTLDEFMKMDLPKASEMVNEKLGNAYIGPFTMRANQLAAAYNVRFPELQPAFRKLDLLLASKDSAVIEAATRMENLTIQEILSEPAGTIQVLPRSNHSQDVFTLSNIAGWETIPDGGGHGDDFARLKSAAPGGGATGAPQPTAFTHCHEVALQVHGVFIPELDEVFQRINLLLGFSAPQAATRTGSPPPV